jgi:uncharacterized metal-binding protein YceD (DUF177 family)
MMTDTQRKTTSYFTVDLAALENGTVVIRDKIPTDWLTHRLSYYEFEARPKKATVDVQIARTGNGILVQGRVSADIATFCGTCLKDIVIDVQSDISTYLVPKTEIETACEELALTPEDLDREYYEGDVVSLDELVGDALMLDLPMTPKCRAQCDGLSQYTQEASGAAIDPRLAPLASIRLNKET